MQRFGEKLRTLRTRRGLSVRALARDLGYATHSYISDIEAGRTIPRVEFTVKIADFFHVALDQLVRDDVELDPDAGVQPTTDETSKEGS
jgi:transcriptional regulator with XRE-family HTH domain